MGSCRALNWLYPVLTSDRSPDLRPVELPKPNLLAEKRVDRAARLDGAWSEELSLVTPVVLFLGRNEIGLAQLPV